MAFIIEFEPKQTKVKRISMSTGYLYALTGLIMTLLAAAGGLSLPTVRGLLLRSLLQYRVGLDSQTATARGGIKP